MAGYGSGVGLTQAIYRGQTKNLNEKKPADPAQIAFVTNNKTLVAACDNLQVADRNDYDDKSPSGIHSRHSTIQINVTDFSKAPSVFVSHYLKPHVIRRLQRMVFVTTGHRAVEWASDKEKTKSGMQILEKLVISRDPYHHTFDGKQKVYFEDKKNPDQKVLANYPWKISISAGKRKSGTQDTFQYSRAFKQLTDDEIQDFFSAIVCFMEVWEVTFGAPLLRELAQYKHKTKGNGEPDKKESQNDDDDRDTI